MVTALLGHEFALEYTKDCIEPVATHGGDRKTPKEFNQVDNINLKAGKGGTSQDYLLARLKRDQPELLDQIGKDKEFRSVRQAAIHAGIVKPKRQITVSDPVKTANRIKRLDY